MKSQIKLMLFKQNLVKNGFMRTLQIDMFSSDQTSQKYGCFLDYG